jgi:hypothetical protein
MKHHREKLAAGFETSTEENERAKLTRQAALQLSTDGPQLVPRMISGQRYCLVWISFVKW